MKDSLIEWTDHTANLWYGCTKVHAGCDHCYAECMAHRWKHDVWGQDKSRKEIASVWCNLSKYQKQAEKEGVTRRVFVGSMMDIFENPMPLVDWRNNPLPGDTGSLRDKLFNEVVPASPNLQFLFLTKRPGNINRYIPKAWLANPPTNVMFGTSPVDQQTADAMIKQLCRVNGKLFLSVEPQLEPLTLEHWLKDKQINWVIQGGESGRGRRPFNLAWAQSLRKECADTGTPYFFKQIDKVQEIPADMLVRQFPE